MFRSRADRFRRRRASDEGFGLVEIMIAMIIFGIVAVATTPLLLGGLKAGRTSQLNLQAKGLGQERLERLRNLPFHVARQNGQYLDVLDIYFRDLTPVGALAVGDACSARIYSAATSTYSCTLANLGAGYTAFTQVVSTQFLRANLSVVTPPAGYTSQTAGADAPAANLLGVTVRTSWSQSGKAHTHTVRSHIANAQADPSTITATLRASALDITSNLPNGDILQFEGGLISSEGSLTTGSIVSLSAVSARAGLASGTSVSGAGLALTAPPTASGTSPDDNTGHYLDGSTCTYACFGHTTVNGDQHLTVASGQPKVSLSGDQVTASLSRSGGNVFRGFTYNNATAAERDPSLGILGPMVSHGLRAPGDTSQVLSGAGHLDATGTGASAVTSAGRVSLTSLHLFPTAFADNGLVQVTLTSASLTCQSGGGATSVTPTWVGVVKYWSNGVYVDLPLAPNAAALPDPRTLNVDGRPLSTWIQAWSSLRNPGPVNESAGRIAKGTVNPVLSILTAQTRAGDVTSPINLAIGSLACVAEDNR